MSFLETHSSGGFKPQSGFTPTEGLKHQADANITKAQLLASNREAVTQPPVNPGGLAAMMLGNRPGVAPASGKPSASFHAQSTGRSDETDAESDATPFSQFMTRHTALPWNSQYQQQDGPLMSTLNFMS